MHRLLAVRAKVGPPKEVNDAVVLATKREQKELPCGHREAAEEAEAPPPHRVV